MKNIQKCVQRFFGTAPWKTVQERKDSTNSAVTEVTKRKRFNKDVEGGSYDDFPSHDPRRYQLGLQSFRAGRIEWRIVNSHNSFDDSRINFSEPHVFFAVQFVTIYYAKCFSYLHVVIYLKPAGSLLSSVLLENKGKQDKHKIRQIDVSVSDPFQSPRSEVNSGRLWTVCRSSLVDETLLPTWRGHDHDKEIQMDSQMVEQAIRGGKHRKHNASRMFSEMHGQPRSRQCIFIKCCKTCCTMLCHAVTL